MKITDVDFLFGPATKGLHETGMVPSVGAPAVTETTTQQIPGGVQETSVTLGPGRMTSAQMVAQDKAAHPIPLGSRWNNSKRAQQFRRDVREARQYEDQIRKMSFALGTTDPKEMEDRLGLMMFAKGMKQAGVPMSDMTQALNIQRQLAPQTSQNTDSAFTPLQLLDAIQKQGQVSTELFGQRNPRAAVYLTNAQEALNQSIGHKEFEMGNKYIKAAIAENIRNSKEYDGLLRNYIKAAPNDMQMLIGDPVINEPSPGPMPQFLIDRLEGGTLDWGNAPRISPEQSIIPFINSGGSMHSLNSRQGTIQELQQAEQMIRNILGRGN